MSKIETIFEITRKNEQPELVATNAIGQEAANLVHKTYYRPRNLLRKILKGFMIDGVFKPLEIEPRLNREPKKQQS